MRLEISWVLCGAETEQAAPARKPARLGRVWLSSQLPAVLSLQDVLELAFSLVYDVEEYCLNFVAPTRYEVSPED